MRVVYNNKKIYKFKKKEIKIIKSELNKVNKINVERMKTIESNSKKKNLEYSSIIRSKLIYEGLHKAMDEKRRIFNELKNMILLIKNMPLLEYIEHLKEMIKEKMERKKQKDENGNEVVEIKDDDEEDNSDSMLDDIYVEQKITSLLSMKKVDRHIRYKIKF